MVETLGSVLRTARKQKGFVLRQVALAVGATTQAVGNWEKDANLPSMENLRKAADYLGIDAEAAHRGELRYLSSEADLSEVERISDIGLPIRGPRDVEVLGVSVGGEDADFTFNGQVVEVVRRPPGIANLRNVFATHVIGTSMSPRYEPGDLLYCGGRPPVPGDDVVIEMFPVGDATMGKAYIKRLIKRTQTLIVCSQFNPPREDIEFDPYAIKAMTRVIPVRELLGY
jgi:phage repressor protein C with HTH and peptisase S24 domain